MEGREQGSKGGRKGSFVTFCHVTFCVVTFFVVRVFLHSGFFVVVCCGVFSFVVRCCFYPPGETIA